MKIVRTLKKTFKYLYIHIKAIFKNNSKIETEDLIYVYEPISQETLIDNKIDFTELSTDFI